MALRTSYRRYKTMIPLLVLSLLMPAFAVAPWSTPAALAQQEIADYSRFYDDLEQYGRWIEHPQWGFVWSPEVDDDEWRPYTRGHWVRTQEHGWYWESEEPWGWATYHYGRWVLDESEGWLWIPGSEWAPAWVAWRQNDDYVGWAPLPPEAVWEEDRGELRFSSSYYDAPRFAPVWCFVAPAYLMTPGLHRHIVPRSRAPYIYRETRFINGYATVNRGVYNHGVDVRIVERATNRPVSPVSILRAGSPREHGSRRGGPGAGAISVYRPNVVAPRANAVGPAPRNFVPSNARGEVVRPDNTQPSISQPNIVNRPRSGQPPVDPTVQREAPREFNRPATEGRPINVEPRREPWQPPRTRGEQPGLPPQILRQPPPQQVERQQPPPAAARPPEGFRQPPPPQVMRQPPPPPPQAVRQAPPPPQVVRQAPPPAPQPGQPPQRKPPIPGQEGLPPR
jgi:hypothetical protein